MEAMGKMNILAALFGIFRQRGLVSTVKEGRSLVGFALSAIVVSIIGAALYGFAMGAGLGIETAVKDAIKLGLIVAVTLLFSIPVFWLAFRLLGREERLSQVAAVPLTLAATVAIILAATAPIVFMLSVLAGFSPEVVYVHIVIVDLALLVGLYVAGTLVYHSLYDHPRLMVPNAVGFLMMAVMLVVLIMFLSPFLSPWPTFSVGTDRLKDGLGIGVAEKVNHALVAATSADQITYRFQTTNENGDLTRDYTVTRLGDDYLIEVHSHTVPGEAFRNQQHIWILDGQHHTDFDQGRVSETTSADLASFLNTSLPPAAFKLSSDFATANWRAFESRGAYTATGTSQSRAQATVVLEAASGRLSSLTLGSAEGGLHAEVRVNEIQSATIDRAALEASLNQATVVGAVDRSDASMQDYVQDDTFFMVRYPRGWRAGTWASAQRWVEFTSSCGASEGCPSLVVSVYDLAEGNAPRQYADDLARSLRLQPEYREIEVSTTTIGGQTVGVVEYLFDRTVRGRIETTQHVEYVFEGQISRYHLDFSAPETHFEASRELFEETANLFTYLKGSL
jgi:hypothetical protein